MTSPPPASRLPFSASPPFDLILGGIPRFEAEAPWSWRLLRRYANDIPAATRIERQGRRLRVADAGGVEALVLVCADPEAYLLPAAAARLAGTLARHPEIDLLLPVSNEPWSEQARAAPPFAYVTPSLLEEAVALFAALPGEPSPASDPRSPVFLTRRSVLDALPPDLPLDEVPEQASRRGFRAAIERAAYVHRYGEMDGQAREDLARLVPANAKAVLDVGCARGATAPALRARGVLRLVGIEPDREDAAHAARVYDEVLALPLERVGEDWADRFDAILFGDVLEHLTDPAAALNRARPWLAPGGLLIASVPNLGHWAVLTDLIEGRFDYVPWSILSGTHLRFFTRSSVTELFQDEGFHVERIDTVTLPVSPLGAERLARLARWPGASADLPVAEFLIVARRRDPGAAGAGRPSGRMSYDPRP